MRVRSNSVKGVSAPEVGARLDNVLFHVWLVSRATYDLLDNALRPAGLDGDEFALYSVLAATDGITPTELSRWMAAPPTTVSSYVKRLEGRGHVVREPNPGDRRSYSLRLSESGRRTHQSAAALFLPALQQVQRALTVPNAVISATLQAVRQAIDEAR